MNALITALVSKCTTLVAGLALSSLGDAALVQVPVYGHALPIVDTPEDKEAQCPYLVVRLVGFEESAGKVNPIVRILGEIYTEGGIADGMTDLLLLVERIRPLVERGPGQVQSFKLLPPAVWQIGDKEDGNQPHPYYQFSLDLRYSGV